MDINTLRSILIKYIYYPVRFYTVTIRQTDRLVGNGQVHDARATEGSRIRNDMNFSPLGFSSFNITDDYAMFSRFGAPILSVNHHMVWADVSGERKEA